MLIEKMESNIVSVYWDTRIERRPQKHRRLKRKDFLLFFAFLNKQALLSEKPVFCIVDDTISSKTKPSSRVLHPIENAYFHQSHPKGKQDYGHQAVVAMISCNGIDNAVILLVYPKDTFHVPKALRALSVRCFLSTWDIWDK